MKRLTISHISSASIRANRKTYMSLAAGILLAVFLATVVTICAYGAVKANEQEVIRKVGYTDCVLYDASDVTDETLRDSGLFESIGKVYLTARVKDSDVYLGFMDEAGYEILCRTCKEGRLPEAPGEIALEQSVIEKLRLEVGVGDSVTWTLTPMDGAEEECTFTIVGILTEQANLYDKSNSFSTSGTDFHWPSVLLSPEKSFATGRAVVQRVMTYAPMVNWYRVIEYHSLQQYAVFHVSHATGVVGIYDRNNDISVYIQATILLLILGVSLLLAVSIGISSAMESVLAAKTEEIGMLRAVGATKRQIRRIFGRDAWLLTAAALPVGLVLGVLAAWLISRIMPEQMVFSLSVWLLLPVIAISAFCIFMSSSVPLWNASRQLPMGVLRDTAMLRKAKRFRSKASFRAPDLIAGRQLRIHPWRQLSASLMIMATLLCTALIGEVAYSMAEEKAAGLQTAAFTLYPGDLASDYYAFSVTKPITALSAQDIAQIRSLPHVDHADVLIGTSVDLVFDEEVPEYFRALTARSYTVGDEGGRTSYSTLDGDGKNGYLYFTPDDPRPAGYDGESILKVREYDIYEEMTAAADAQGLEGKLLQLSFYICTLDDEKYTVAEGKVDLAALDAGEQVLIYAPTIYLLKYNEGVLTSVTREMNLPVAGEFRNDAFHVGQSLTLIQLLNDEIWQEAETYDAWRAVYAAMDRVDIQVSVGAVLEGEPISGTYIGIITTEKGAEALGLDQSQSSFTTVRVYLDGDVDEKTEEALVSRLEGIAMRGGMVLWNGLEDMRESAVSQRQFLILWGSMVILFFAVSVAMQVGNAGRRIRSDQRMIGTLRAVGADVKALLGCYRLPMTLTAVIGSFLAIAVYLSFVLATHTYESSHPAVIVPAMLILGTLCVLCCLGGLRVKLKTVFDASIVENIREL